ncbi:MAG TPA: squalene/phytoene synthase family protein [Solirubrobacteraceae bacterium]|jgi:phytoene synthase|nr:squalene/phytoene synthase family protein [Solirubrobacteraceae bacterium]
MTGADAYEYCEALTRRAAGNFYYGIRLLPRSKRQAMCAVYAYARRVDDIGDGRIEAHEKLALLDACERSLQGLPTSLSWGQASMDPVMAALADARARFGLPMDALEGLLAGVRMDVQGARYETFEELLVYCRLVAGTIGRLCLAIFGSRDSSRATALADDLGVAMQLTNILRDICEDAANGRVYIPREDLDLYRLSADGRFDGGEGQLDAMMRFQARRAGEWFEQGLELVGLLDRRSGACVLAMSNIYRGVLERIVDDPEAARRRRVSLPIWRKGWVATRSLLAAASA